MEGLRNGELLNEAATHGFDAMLTKDAGIEYEQNLRPLPIAVVLLKAKSNAIDDLKPLIPNLLRALATLNPKIVTKVP